MLAVDTFDGRAMSESSAARGSMESSCSTAWIVNLTRKPPKPGPAGRPAHARSPLVGGGEHVEDHRDRRDVRPEREMLDCGEGALFEAGRSRWAAGDRLFNILGSSGR